ncbi:MAG: precorrin-6y C5,15-methyltransferase (decarboxylating) subunit CbiE [Parvibaculaceae bacterium]
MSAWLTIVGMGEDGLDGLSPVARDAIENAQVLVGSSRLLALVPEGKARRVRWPSPFDASAAIAPYRGQAVVVLATGDPMHYGAGRAILAAFDPGKTRVLPHASAFTLAAARLGWPLQEAEIVSLHGRSATLIEPLIAPDARILALTEGDSTVREVARRLVARGYGGSSMTALEHMGGKLERCIRFSAEGVPATPFSDLLTLAVECIPSADAPLLQRSPGLPDDAFRHDGLITKQEVRAITLAALAPYPGALLWDVGAGCGSIAIEWIRAASRARATAFERDPERLKHIAHNADALGTPGLRIVPGNLPGSLGVGDETPDAVFVGGALGVPGVVEESWEALRSGGRMVANVVTIEGEAHLMDLHEKHGGELLRIEISHVGAVGPFRAMRPKLPVTQWRARKP